MLPDHCASQRSHGWVLSTRRRGCTCASLPRQELDDDETGVHLTSNYEFRARSYERKVKRAIKDEEGESWLSSSLIALLTFLS
eukprot:1478719-Alexandrium_andersonii.AAC.1